MNPRVNKMGGTMGRNGCSKQHSVNLHQHAGEKLLTLTHPSRKNTFGSLPSTVCDGVQNGCVLTASAAVVNTRNILCETFQKNLSGYFFGMVPFALLVFSMLADANNYTVLLRHGSMADCPCFRIPTLVATGSYSSIQRTPPSRCL